MVDAAIEKLAQNVWLLLVGRIAVVACAVAFPIAGKMLWAISEGQLKIERTFDVWQAKTDAQIDGIKNQLMSLGAIPRYMPSDAERDLKLRDLQINTLQQRLQDLEHEIRKPK